MERLSEALGRLTVLILVGALAGCPGAGGELAAVPGNGGPGPTPDPQAADFRLPDDGADLVAPLTISVAADGLTRAEFSVDGEVIHTATDAPFEYEFDPQSVAAGEHTLAITAIWPDSGQTASVSVRTMPAPPAPPPPPGEYPPNTWVTLEPQRVIPAPFSNGRAGKATWGGFVYRADNGTILSGGGYRDDEVGGERRYSIYDNSIWSLDLRANTSTMLTVTGWAGGTSPQWELEGWEGKTPPNRHLYNGMTYVPTTKEIHWVGGANTRTDGLDMAQTWAYSTVTGTWRKTGRLSSSSVFEGHLHYIPDQDVLLFFGNYRIWKHVVADETGWEVVNADTDPHRFWAAASTWDSKRKRIVFYDDSKDSGNNRDLVAYDPETGDFTTIANDGPGPTGLMTYNSKHDVYVVVGRTDPQVWVFDPDTSNWSRVSMTGRPNDDVDDWYLTYDPVNDVHVVGGDGFWAFRYTP